MQLILVMEFSALVTAKKTTVTYWYKRKHHNGHNILKLLIYLSTRYDCWSKCLTTTVSILYDNQKL